MLLRQLLLSLNRKMSVCVRGRRARLPAADRDHVISRRDQTIPGLIDVAQIARPQRQLDVLLLAGIQMNASESPQSRSGAPAGFGKVLIESFLDIGIWIIAVRSNSG